MNIFAATKKIAPALMLLFGIAAAQTPLESHLKRRGDVLPNIVYYNDLHNAALDEGMVDLAEVLAKNKVEMFGEADRRYVRMKDLLRVCGKECNYHKGWGIFLSQFAVQVHRR
ncbi:MAG: hypothetical protein ACR2P5_01120 [Gammaproteobacteria bacterium]